MYVLTGNGEVTGYAVLSTYFDPAVGSKTACLALLGTRAGMYVQRTTSTLIEVREESNSITLILSDVSKNPIGAVLRIMLVTNG